MLVGVVTFHILRRGATEKIICRFDGRFVLKWPPKLCFDLWNTNTRCVEVVEEVKSDGFVVTSLRKCSISAIVDGTSENDIGEDLFEQVLSSGASGFP